MTPRLLCSGGAVVTAAKPLALQSLRNFVDVVNLIDGHALIREMQCLIVHVRVEIALAAKHFLNPSLPHRGQC